MHNKINKLLWIFVFFLLIFLALFILYNEKSDNLKAYEKRFYYMDSYIYIKLYTNTEEKAGDAFDKINLIYKKYHELADRNNGYPGLKNIYYIKNNNEENEYLEIDYKLYEILELGLLCNKKTNELFDIKLGNLTDVWFNYKNRLISKPTIDQIDKINIEEVVLKDGSILNNHPNIDLNGFIKGYTNNIVKNYLYSIGIDKFIINAGGNILVGKHYGDGKYIIGIEDPTKNDLSIFLKVLAVEKTIVTKGNYDSNMHDGDKTYINIVNPKTKILSDNFLSVTVISPNPIEADVISNILPLMKLEEALEFVESKKDVEAIFYISDDEQVMSSGFKEYLNK